MWKSVMATIVAVAIGVAAALVQHWTQTPPSSARELGDHMMSLPVPRHPTDPTTSSSHQSASDAASAEAEPLDPAAPTMPDAIGSDRDRLTAELLAAGLAVDEIEGVLSALFPDDSRPGAGLDDDGAPRSELDPAVLAVTDAEDRSNAALAFALSEALLETGELDADGVDRGVAAVMGATEPMNPGAAAAIGVRAELEQAGAESQLIEEILFALEPEHDNYH